jgi:hypothetical protein
LYATAVLLFQQKSEIRKSEISSESVRCQFEVRHQYPADASAVSVAGAAAETVIVSTSTPSELARRYVPGSETS